MPTNTQDIFQFIANDRYAKDRANFNPWSGGLEPTPWSREQAQSWLSGQGMTPEQYWTSMGPQSGMATDGQGNLFKDPNSTLGNFYDPATGQVRSEWQDGGSDFGNVLLALGTAAVGNISGGFGLGELFSGAGGAGQAAGTAADAPWGADLRTGGGMFDFGSYDPSNPFGFGGDNPFSSLGQAAPGDFTASMLPGGEFSGTAGGMANLGGIGGVAGVNAGGSGGLWETIKGMMQAGNTAKSIASSLGISEGDVSLIGKLGSAALGAYGANQQSNNLSALAERYSNYGAPSRARFEASMSPGFDPTTIPGYSGALDTASKGLLARLSATGGNPFGNPGGLIDANKQIVAGTAMPAINEYQRLNANTGFGSSMNAAVPLQTGAIQSQGNVLNALGVGIDELTKDPNSLANIMKSFQNAGLKFSL